MGTTLRLVVIRYWLSVNRFGKIIKEMKLLRSQESEFRSQNKKDTCQSFKSLFIISSCQKILVIE